ncbi:MAG TPA: SusC/RagA family TonB-linked outer membrane protein [Paludibacter sp.]|nr:SusC/RagA family TonB-linked outer membrane protein [Paludibacter sp.]
MKHKNNLASIQYLRFIWISVFFFCIAINSIAQVTVKAKNVPIRQILKNIEKTTDYKFFYNDDFAALDKVASLNVNNVSIDKALSTLFTTSGISWEQKDKNQIVLVPSKMPDTKAQPSDGQIHKITGTVTDASTGETLLGVSVVVDGTKTGVISDLNGKFTIEVPSSSSELVFSYIGYIAKKVAVGKQSIIKVALEQDSKKLDEVVVVGYGTQKKVNLTGSVGNVQMSDMETRPLTDASLALQGTVAGVYALQSSGKPGDDNAIISIRGVGTFGNNNPLVIIDGFPGNLSDVNANDIKSVSVLKDAASSSIYGNRAANGVILITTKRGSAGKMSVSYNGYFGVQEATRLPKVLNSVDYATLKNEAAANSGRVASFTDADIQKFAAHNDPMYPDINYFDVYYGKAQTQNHRLSLTGGNENVQFAFMLGQLNQDGIMVATDYKKTDFRSNIDAFFLKDKKLRVSTKLAGNLGVKNEPTSMWNATWYATLAPIYPLQNAAGQYMSVNGELNPYAEIEAGSTAKTKRYDLSAQFEAEYKFFKDLSAQVTYGYNVMSSNRNAFNANVVLQNKAGGTKTEQSDLNITNETDVQTMLTGLLKYNKTFGEHELNVLAGYSEEEFTYDWQSGYRKNFVNNTQRVLNLGDAATQKNDAGSYDLGLRSYFGRINYGFQGKYLVEANIRRDGSSRFTQGHQWGTFPSFSGGWIISKEEFMKNASWLNLLKLRASWGQLGNESIGNYYNGSDILSSGQNYSLGGTLYSGVAIQNMTNKLLKWETAQQLNFGVDFNLKNGIELTADYFDKRTKDLLKLQPIPATMALGYPYANAGEVQNQGIEASITYRKSFTNGLKLRTTLNLAHIVNKITKLDVNEELTSPKAIIVGSAINSFYGYQMDGIYQTSDFTGYDQILKKWILKPGVVKVTDYSAEPGDIKFKDLDGDGVVDQNHDRKVIGKQFPDLSYSMNINLEWKRFDFSMFFQGVQGIQGYFYYEIATPFSGVANLGSWWMDRWTPTNPSNTMPKVTLNETHTNVHSSFYMEDASYLRLKNIELGYTIDPKILSKIGISSVRIYGNIQNAFTLTKFKGFDPEQKTDQTRAEAFPQVRVMTVGLNVNF